MKKPTIIVIAGPTASGKSDLGVYIAQHFNGEVISADSRQVYKGLDIGTGKITPEEMQSVPHHLLDICKPQTTFSVEKYKKRGEKTIEEIIKRNKIPIIVGGTGFYIDALVDNILLPEVKPNIALRKKLSHKTPEELFNMLKKIDSARAKNIDPKNSRRLIRALEIAQKLGSIPNLSARHPNKYKVFKIGLTLPKDTLKLKIEKRLIQRLNQGMIEEAQRLHKEGLSWKRMDELGLEYRYLASHLQGKISREEMIEKLKTEIWHYAKRQMTWFKRDKKIHWFTPEQLKQIEEKIKDFLTNEKAQ